MSWLRPFALALAALETFLDRILCVVGAVVFSQVPEFFQQYLQRLGGHLDEARRQLDLYRQTAAQSGLTVEQLAAKLAAQGEPVDRRLGVLVGNASD